jgi:hypothetical protein
MWKAYILDYYDNESFPIFGWIKPCIYCLNIVSSYMTKKYKDKDIIIHACKKCIIKYENDMKKEKMIYYHLSNAKFFEKLDSEEEKKDCEIY